MVRLSCKPGTIVAIPLTDGRFAFAKVFADNMLGVYDWVSPSVPLLAQVLGQAFAFHQATTLVAITRGDWPTLGVEPFACEDDAWAPPLATCYARETGKWTMGGPKLYHREQIRSASLDEVIGLHILCVSPRPEVFVRLIEDILVHRLGEQHRVRID